MKKRCGHLFFALVLVIGAILLFQASCFNRPIIPTDNRNKDVIDFRDFSVNTESIGLTTTVEGTVFVKGNKDGRNERAIQIVARVSIDQKDWGGVGFITNGWQVVNVDSPVGELPTGGVYEILLADDVVVSVGSYYLQHPGANVPSAQFRGSVQDGTVVINLEPIKGHQPQASFEIDVAAGSRGEMQQHDYWSIREKVTIPPKLDSKTP